MKNYELSVMNYEKNAESNKGVALDHSVRASCHACEQA